jgi:hypothetical protein
VKTMSDRSNLREVQVGDLLPRSMVRSGRTRHIEATAFVVPGDGNVSAYLHDLEQRQADFADWDGRVVVLDRDGAPEHGVVVADRYGQATKRRAQWTSTPYRPPAR